MFMGGFTYIREVALPPTSTPTSTPSQSPSTPNPTISFQPSSLPTQNPTRVPTEDHTFEFMAGNKVGTQRGGMFDITAKVDMRIISFHVHLNTDAHTNMEVWTKPGSCNGYEKEESAWDELCTAYVTSAGYKVYSYLPNECFQPIPMGNGETRAFYIPSVDEGAEIVFSPKVNNMVAGDIYASNTDMDLKVGSVVGYRFGNKWGQRRWNGAVIYTIDGTHTPTSKPSSAPTVSALPSLSPTISYAPSSIPTTNPTRKDTVDKDITTTMQGGYRGHTRGLMFDIVAQVDLRILAFGTNLDNTIAVPHEVEVWTKVGSCQGYQKDQSAWTKICAATVTSLGYKNVTPLPYDCFNPVVLKQGDRQSFYVATVNPEKIGFSGNGGGASMDVYEGNDDLDIFIGYMIKYPFTGTAYSRRWNGQVTYTVDGTHSPSMKPSDVSV